MSDRRHRALWVALGVAFLLGGAAPLVLFILNLVTLEAGASETQTLGLWCAFLIMLGFTSLAAGRVTAALRGDAVKPWHWPWTVLACVGAPLGTAVFFLELQHTVAPQLMFHHEAVLLAAALTFVAGLVPFVSEPIVRRAQLRTRTRVDRGIASAELAARLVRVH